jgi:presqualene diphosphate synthase
MRVPAFAMTAHDSRGHESARHHVRAVTRAAGSSFYWAMRLLPAERRDAMFAVYAFCREVDDIADDPAPPESKRARLAEWRVEIARIYDGEWQTMTGRALAEAVPRFALDRADFLAVIDGMEMDVAGTMVAPAMSDLDLYCGRVAGAVGLLSIRIFGAHDARAPEFALALGHALQLTNILRDLRQDAALERLYLPRELLSCHGILSNDPATVLAHPALPAICEALARRAEEKYREAADALAACSGGALRPAVVMMVHYRRILQRLRREGWADLDRRVGVTRAEKLWIALRYGVLDRVAPMSG